MALVMAKALCARLTIVDNAVEGIKMLRMFCVSKL